MAGDPVLRASSAVVAASWLYPSSGAIPALARYGQRLCMFAQMIGAETADLWFERCETVRIQAVTGRKSDVRLTRRRGVGEARRRGDATAYGWSHVTGHDDLSALTPAWFHGGLEELTAAWEPEPPRLAVQSVVVETLLRRAADLGWGRTE